MSALDEERNQRVWRASSHVSTAFADA